MFSGELSPVEYRILDQYFDHLRSKPPTMVNLFVYLRTDPEVVHERIRKRSRREEDAISMVSFFIFRDPETTNHQFILLKIKEYLRKIHKLHEKLFIEKPDEIWNRINCAGKKDQSVIVIDGNHSFDIVYENFIDSIRKWLQKSQMIHTDVKQPPPPPSPQQQQQKQRH